MSNEPRRSFLQRASGILGSVVPAALLGACRAPSSTESSTAAPAAAGQTSAPNPRVVRVVSVPTAVEGELLPALVAEFEKESDRKVELSATSDLYSMARSGQVDLAISHYGHKHAEQFVMDGYGQWPRTLFSNQMALIGPKEDPAKIRGLDDAAEAFKRIASSKSPFVLNDIDGVRYLTEILWNAAGRPERGDWFIHDRKHRKEAAIQFAASKRAYVFWGLTPFLRASKNAGMELEPLVLGDPLLQRMLVSILVNPSKVAGVNHDGANELQSYLLAPATQARIRQAPYPGGLCTWTPGGRHNATAALPKV